jgi:subtilisin family serine protease
VRYRYHLVRAIAASVPATAVAESAETRVTVVETTAYPGDRRGLDSVGVKRIGRAVRLETAARRPSAIVDSRNRLSTPTSIELRNGIDRERRRPWTTTATGLTLPEQFAAEDDGVGVVGVAPKALLYGVKVLSSTGSGSWSDIIAGIEWAADNLIDVTNNSYGGSGNPGTIVQAAYDNSCAGVLHVAAAGNSGACPPTGDTVLYPAKFTSVIAVAATTSTDARACFSSTGPKVEIAAPGSSINSTRRTGGYTFMSGTSMASPHVAGVAALVRRERDDECRSSTEARRHGGRHRGGRSGRRVRIRSRRRRPSGRRWSGQCGSASSHLDPR